MTIGTATSSNTSNTQYTAASSGTTSAQTSSAASTYSSGTPTAQEAAFFLQGLYHDVLWREPDQGGFSWWQAQIMNGVSLSDVAKAFNECPEAEQCRNYLAVITPNYAKYLGRTGYYEELKAGIAELRNGGSAQSIGERILKSAEAIQYRANVAAQVVVPANVPSTTWQNIRDYYVYSPTAADLERPLQLTLQETLNAVSLSIQDAMSKSQQPPAVYLPLNTAPIQSVDYRSRSDLLYSALMDVAQQAGISTSGGGSFESLLNSMNPAMNDQDRQIVNNALSQANVGFSVTTEGVIPTVIITGQAGTSTPVPQQTAPTAPSPVTPTAPSGSTTQPSTIYTVDRNLVLAHITNLASQIRAKSDVRRIEYGAMVIADRDGNIRVTEIQKGDGNEVSVAIQLSPGERIVGWVHSHPTNSAPVPSSPGYVVNPGESSDTEEAARLIQQSAADPRFVIAIYGKGQDVLNTFEYSGNNSVMQTGVIETWINGVIRNELF